jgi:hypothetical protein
MGEGGERADGGRTGGEPPVEPPPVERAPVEPPPVDVTAVAPAPVDTPPVDAGTLESPPVDPAPPEPTAVHPTTVEPVARPLREEELSGLFQPADVLAVRSQRQFVRSMRARYALLVAAACAGTFSFRLDDGADLVAVLGAVCFGGSLLLRVYLGYRDSELTWLRSRSVAESVRSESWRYAVGADPYPEDLTPEQARRVFLSRQRDEIADLGAAAVAGNTAMAYVTDAMTALRRAAAPERRTAYLDGRVADQMTWYARKSARHQRLAERWFMAMLLAEAAGLSAGVLKAADLLDLDLLGVFAALAAAFGAWNQMRQHRRTAAVYGGTASRLATLEALGREGLDDDEWAPFVDRVESILAEEAASWQSLRAVEPGRAVEESVG